MKSKSKKASKNVFVDLGFDPAEAAVLQMRVNLMSDLRKHIEDNEFTQAEEAERLGVAAWLRIGLCLKSVRQKLCQVA